MSIREFSIFLTAAKCEDCDWLDTPMELRDLVPGMFSPLYSICPECGGQISGEIGKFHVKETYSFFGGIRREIISFMPRAARSPSQCGG